MKPGIYKNCIIVGCFTGVSKVKETPYFGLEFENQDGETIEHAFYLSEKIKDKNIELLINLGYKAKSIADMSNPRLKINDLFGKANDSINLTIEEETYTNNEGVIKTKTVVRWVNVGDRFGTPKFDHAVAVNFFKGATFDGELMLKRKGRPAPDPLPEKSKSPTDQFSSEEIPF